MVKVTVKMETELRWVCKECHANFPVCGEAPDNPNGEQDAIAHERSCGFAVRIGSAPPWLVFNIEEPTHGDG